MISCQQAAEALPEYLDETLTPEAREAVDRHLDVCAECRELLELWERLGELPEPVPGPNVRRRFEKALAAETSPPARTITFRLPDAKWLGWAAAAAVVFAVGWLGGRYSSPAPPPPETAALREEVRDLRSLVAVSLLNQQSASDRLKGITYAGQIRGTSPDVLDALVHALKFDSNVNVRLAACDALRSHANDAGVRKAFREALGAEESPLAKVALIDAVAGIQERDSARVLAQLAAAPNEDSAVQQRAARALERFKQKGIRWE